MPLEGLFDEAKERVMPHQGHKVGVFTYGMPKDPVNITVECVDCGEVLIDFEQEEGDDG